MARVTQFSTLARYSPRQLALVLAHKLGAQLKFSPLPTGIPLTPACVTPLATIILITARLTHANISCSHRARRTELPIYQMCIYAVGI